MTAVRTILVVDANPLARDSASRMFRRAHAGVRVVATDRLEAALEFLSTQRTDMVITDIHLRQGNGLRLTEAIAKRFPAITVVVFTHDDSPEYRDEALRRGADYFFAKTEPNGRALVDIIRKRSATAGGA